MPILYADQRESTHIAGRPPRRRMLTPKDIADSTDQLLSYDNSSPRRYVLELLNEFGILCEHTLFALIHERVAISDNISTFQRQLRAHKRAGLIGDAPYGVLKAATRAGLPKPSAGTLRAFCLGPAGEEYIRRKRGEARPPKIASAEEHLAHDLICAEAMLKMRALWKEHTTSAGLVEVRGPGEVSVWDAEKKTHLVAPDGLLIKRKPGGEFENAFLVEYQNVRALLQVQAKLKKYEELADRAYRWVWDFWGVDEMPWVLVIHRQGATLRHYQDEIARRGALVARFAAIALDDIWAGKLHIKPLNGSR